VSATTIGRWVGEGRLHPRHRGVYAVGHLSPAPEARWAGALLACGEDSALSRHAALANHGLGRPPALITVVVARKARAHRGVRAHRSTLHDGEVVIRKGLRTTSVERTLLDIAAIGEPVERLVAEATAKRLTSIAKLRAYLERRAGARGGARLRRCIEGRQTRSRAEDEFARWIEAQGIDPPEFNVPFGPYTLDAVWPERRLVVEVDTYETHGTRHSFEADRERDGYLLARGLRTIRVTPRQWRERSRELRRQLAADLGQ
jgi:very-short-patch-repair endonuclease